MDECVASSGVQRCLSHHVFCADVIAYAEYFKEHGDEVIEPLGVRFLHDEVEIEALKSCVESSLRLPWCAALRVVSESSALMVTRETIGCPAGAISLGLIDENEATPLEGERPYTDLMEKPAPPAEFTSGRVYACQASGHMEYSLFGPGDTGRFASLDAARRALETMAVIRPPTTGAVVAYHAEEVELHPDVVVLPVTPRQALRVIQAQAFETGERTNISTLGLRGVCSDVTAAPYLEGRINGSFFCLGARALAGWPGELLVLGMPHEIFHRIVGGMIKSAGGFPYEKYPR